MAVSNEQQALLEGVLLAQRDRNRYLLPPPANAGIGQWQSALVPAVFGGLSVFGVVDDQPLTDTPVKLEGFNEVVPNGEGNNPAPEGMLPDFLNSEIILLDAGVYNITLAINANIAAGQSYGVNVHLNGEPTELITLEDLSNQSTFLTLQLSGALPVPEQGSILSLYGFSGSATPQQFILVESLFFVNRIR